jgi:biopolymer transport protein ExbD
MWWRNNMPEVTYFSFEVEPRNEIPEPVDGENGTSMLEIIMPLVVFFMMMAMMFTMSQSATESMKIEENSQRRD